MERGYCRILKRFRRQGANGGKSPVALVEVESVADDKFVFDFKADPAGVDISHPLSLFA